MGTDQRMRQSNRPDVPHLAAFPSARRGLRQIEDQRFVGG
jgi:hypothetical protein